ncbi:MAG TPA: GNAT family N-acetyltransferase [Chloroflexota bacterium]|jgi:GNAT superfamily N-acetyltransferase|nr:GNAT family N-acetyltransferase [Chloroflexota bacterium]
MIRPASATDVPAVVELGRRWAEEGSTLGQLPISAEQARGWLGPYFWVADDGAGPIGYVYAAEETSPGLVVLPAGQRYLRIEELYVVPERRSQGVGGRLLDRVLEEAADRGVTRARVYTASVEWQRSIAFYGRHGFRMWYVEMYR